jgi:hypothetical protein
LNGVRTLAGRNRPRKTGFPTPRASTSALGARQARSHDGMGLWIDHGTLAALRRERMACEEYSEVILRLAQATTLGDP